MWCLFHKIVVVQFGSGGHKSFRDKWSMSSNILFHEVHALPSSELQKSSIGPDYLCILWKINQCTMKCQQCQPVELYENNEILSKCRARNTQMFFFTSYHKVRWHGQLAENNLSRLANSFCTCEIGNILSLTIKLKYHTNMNNKQLWNNRYLDGSMN
jgi:hypothetical protein